MSRAPFQVLIFPFIASKCRKQIEYAIFKREDMNLWQGIAGGGESDESFLEAAQRETFEESGICQSSRFITLTSMTTIPVEFISKYFLWGNNVYVIPEYSFGVEVKDKNICLSSEHKEVQWVSYRKAIKMLKWDSNKSALWELEKRIKPDSCCQSYT